MSSYPVPPPARDLITQWAQADNPAVIFDFNGTLSDDEPIPRYPTGGDGTVGGPGQLGAGENLTEFLRKQGSPPSNIELRKVWRKAGLLDKTRPLKPGSSQKRDRSDDRG